jgi:methylenetetrahydrofolate dehydrogenase (NADP+)/methenyltetrahydrofolate cyclohydrolase
MAVGYVLDNFGLDVKGKQALVVGRSFQVGFPISVLLQKMDATVTVAHEYTDKIELENLVKNVKGFFKVFSLIWW